MMDASPSIQLRALRAEDIDAAMRLSLQAGWNQTRRDWQRLLALEPQGCFVAEVRGQPAGTVTTTRYADGLGWIGMLLVAEEFRSRGLGRALLQQAIGYLRGQGVLSLKLDATPMGQALYEPMGFQPEWTLQRWECDCLNVSDPPQTQLPVPAQDSDKPSMAQLDAVVFGTDRSVLRERLTQDGALLRVLNSSQQGLEGFGFIRPGSRADYIGPVVAQTGASAEALVKTLLHARPGKRVYWDIPDPNRAAQGLARWLGFKPQRTLARMVLGENPCPGDPQRLFAIAGPEVG